MKQTFNSVSIIAILAYLFLFTACKEDNNEENIIQNKQAYVIMLSMDGFRWDYTDLVNTPNFDKIAQKGIKSIVRPSFPTKTFPNHYSIATGLYPDNHGIVNNTFWDPNRQVIYKISDRDKVTDGYFYGGEPIWVTAEKQGVKAASYFWVGSEAEINGYRPSIWKLYDHNFPYYQRADSVISWLQLPENKRPHLITWYVDQPDSYGHKYGPNSDEIKTKVEELDALLGYFMNEIDKLKISDEIDVIITSDHGMGEIRDDKFINLKNMFNSSWDVFINGGNPVYNIWVKDNFKDSVEQVLSNINHIHYYTKNTIPERLHYMNNERCGQFVVMADSGYALYNKSSVSSFGIAGAHGYDNENMDMDAMFYAYGPHFKNNYEHQRFNNVDIYSLICNILDLQMAPNDGEFNNVKELLK